MPAWNHAQCACPVGAMQGPPAAFGNCYSLTVLTIRHPYACKFTFKIMILDQ